MQKNRRATDKLTNLTTKQAAEVLQVSPRTVVRMIERGSIQATKLDPNAKSVYRISIEEVQRILRERSTFLPH